MLKDLGPYAFPPAAIMGRVMERHHLQLDQSDYTWVAKHSLIWEYGGHVSLDPFLLANSAETAAGLKDTVQESGKSQCSWVATRDMDIIKP